MKRVIIESPFKSKNILQRIRYRIYLNRCIRDCLSRVESPYASHAVLTRAINENDKKERARGIRAGLEWLPKADLHVFYEDYGVTVGMAYAKRMGKSIDIKREIRKIGKNPSLWDLFLDLLFPGDDHKFECKLAEERKAGGCDNDCYVCGYYK